MKLRQLVAARQIVDASGAAGLFEDWILPRRADGTPERRGVKRTLSVRTLLLGLACAAIDDREMQIVRVTDTIRSWNRNQRRALGISSEEGSALPSITHKKVSDLWNRIALEVTASPHFAEPKLPDGLSDEEKAELLATRHVRLQDIVDRLLDGSLTANPDDSPQRPDPAWETGHYVTDWTYLPSWAAKRARGLPSPDPDASWINIEGHGYDRKWHLVGYKVHALVRTRTPNGPRVPYVVERLVIDTASSQSKAPVLNIVRRMNSPAADGLPAGERRVRELVADRGYSKNGGDDWVRPLMALGVRPVFDLTEAQMGLQGSTQGALVVNGCLMCPAIPEQMITQDRLEDFETASEREAKFEAVERSRKFELVAHSAPDPMTGNQRMSCPASAGKVRCPLVADSMNLSPVTVSTVHPSAELRADPPPVCTQKTVTIPGGFAVDVRQPYRWGTPEWFDAYDRRTPNVESVFGVLRQPGKQHMARGRIMCMGLAKNTLLLAFQVAAANLRLVDAYLASTAPRVSDRVRRKSRKRRAVPYADLTPAGQARAVASADRRRRRKPTAVSTASSGR